MPSVPAIEIRCRICDEGLTLGADVAVRIAEAHTFAAAHSSHAEGIAVKVEIRHDR